MIRYLVLDKLIADNSHSFVVHVWTCNSDQESVTHIDYIALLAGVKKDVTTLNKAEKKTFYDTLHAVSSWGKIQISPSRGWVLDEIETSPHYRNRLEQDCSLVRKYLETAFDLPYQQSPVAEVYKYFQIKGRTRE